MDGRIFPRTVLDIFSAHDGCPKERKEACIIYACSQIECIMKIDNLLHACIHVLLMNGLIYK